MYKNSLLRQSANQVVYSIPSIQYVFYTVLVEDKHTLLQTSSASFRCSRCAGDTISKPDAAFSRCAQHAGVVAGGR